MRASDAERETVAQALQTHAAAGRLDPDALEQRLERVYAARLRADLVPLTADLPAAPALRTPEPRREREGLDVPPVVPVAILLIAIWALTGGGYFWPIWPIVAMALATAKHAYCGHRRVGPTTSSSKSL